MMSFITRRPILRAVFASAAVILASAPLTAGDADVVDVSIAALGDSKFRIDATVAHGDTGWEHYADRWDVLTEDGNVIGTRVLHHPHETEQPFTRSLTLVIPADIARGVIRAGDLVHGDDGGKTITVDVPH